MTQILYMATFVRPLSLDNDDKLRIAEQSPLFLSEVIELCTSMGVSAELFDTQSGVQRGSVSKNGNFAVKA